MTKLQVTVENNFVHFFETEANRKETELTIKFHRTLRVPDDGKIYPLPPSLGVFPVCKVDDYLDKVPDSWKKQGGVFLPMYQREAMWIEFNLENKKSPKAIKVAVGKVNALTGETWTNNLNSNGLQDYVVAPLQSWLDGINSGDGKVRQFVAMPLGSGYSVEAQVTGKEEFGGLQLMVLNSREEEKRVVYPVQPPPNINSTTTTQVPQTPPLLLQYPQTNPPTLPTKKKGILSWIADLFRPSSEPLTMSIAGIPTGKLRNEFYNHGPIKVAYSGVNHLKSGAWICVYESGQASTDFGMYLERWQYIAGNGEFTIPTNNLREGVLYHFRLFPNGSSYDPVATSEPFTIRHSGLPNTYVTATAPQLPEPEQIECWCEEDQSYDLNDQAYNIVPQSTTTGFSIPNIFRPSHTVNESASVSLARSAVPQQESTRLPAHRRRRPVQPEAKEMGISTGGSMKQKIVEDPYGLSFWDQDSGARVFVHIVNSEMFKQITGRDPPETTITAQTYTNLGYKWYDVYEEGVNGVAASSVLGNVKSVTQIDSEKYAWPQQDNTSINIQGSQVVTITNPNGVRDGDW